MVLWPALCPTCVVQSNNRKLQQNSSTHTWLYHGIQGSPCWVCDVPCITCERHQQSYAYIVKLKVCRICHYLSWALPRRFSPTDRLGVKAALWASRTACQTIDSLLDEAGGSFSCLEPSAQALVQASAKAVVQRDVLPLDDPLMLWLVRTVPLLHAVDYNRLLLQVATVEGEGNCLNSWQQVG